MSPYVGQPLFLVSRGHIHRCWLFATTNVLRYSIMKKLKLDDFQLSQSYLFIYDKLEKVCALLACSEKTLIMRLGQLLPRAVDCARGQAA